MSNPNLILLLAILWLVGLVLTLVFNRGANRDKALVGDRI